MFNFVTSWAQKNSQPVIFLAIPSREMVSVPKGWSRQILLAIRATPILFLPEGYLASPVLAGSFF